MWDFIAGTFALTVVVALIGGIIGTISPRLVQFGRAEPPTRKRVAGVAFATLVAAFIGFAFTVPDPTPEQKAAIEAQKIAASALERKNAADANARHRDEILSLWSSIKNAGAICDKRHDPLMDAIGRNDRYAAYEHASALNDACNEAFYAVKDLEPPAGLADESKDALEEAMEMCANAYFLKSQGYAAMAKVFDGDERPSAVTAAREASEVSQMAVMKCAADFMVAADKLGIPPAEFANESKEVK